MGGKIFLDTNAVVAILRGNRRLLTDLADVEVWLSAIVIGELHCGIEKSVNFSENLELLEELLAEFKIADVNQTVSREYGAIHNELRVRGQPIPSNDIWIAATTRIDQSTLITRDAHFDRVPNLHVERW